MPRFQDRNKSVPNNGFIVTLGLVILLIFGVLIGFFVFPHPFRAYRDFVAPQVLIISLGNNPVTHKERVAAQAAAQDWSNKRFLQMTSAFCSLNPSNANTWLDTALEKATAADYEYIAVMSGSQDYVYGRGYIQTLMDALDDAGETKTYVALSSWFVYVTHPSITQHVFGFHKYSPVAPGIRSHFALSANDTLYMYAQDTADAGGSATLKRDLNTMLFARSALSVQDGLQNLLCDFTRGFEMELDMLDETLLLLEHDVDGVLLRVHHADKNIKVPNTPALEVDVSFRQELPKFMLRDLFGTETYSALTGQRDAPQLLQDTVATVTTNMLTQDPFPPELAFDGSFATYFRSLGPARKGDYLEIRLDNPVQATVLGFTGSLEGLGDKNGTYKSPVPRAMLLAQFCNETSSMVACDANPFKYVCVSISKASTCRQQFPESVYVLALRLSILETTDESVAIRELFVHNEPVHIPSDLPRIPLDIYIPTMAREGSPNVLLKALASTVRMATVLEDVLDLQVWVMNMRPESHAALELAKTKYLNHPFISFRPFGASYVPPEVANATTRPQDPRYRQEWPADKNYPLRDNPRVVTQSTDLARLLVTVASNSPMAECRRFMMVLEDDFTWCGGYLGHYDDLRRVLVNVLQRPLLQNPPPIYVSGVRLSLGFGNVIWPCDDLFAIASHIDAHKLDWPPDSLAGEFVTQRSDEGREYYAGKKQPAQYVTHRLNLLLHTKGADSTLIDTATNPNEIPLPGCMDPLWHDDVCSGLNLKEECFRNCPFPSDFAPCNLFHPMTDQVVL